MTLILLPKLTCQVFLLTSHLWPNLSSLPAHLLRGHYWLQEELQWRVAKLGCETINLLNKQLLVCLASLASSWGRRITLLFLISYLPFYPLFLALILATRGWSFIEKGLLMCCFSWWERWQKVKQNRFVCWHVLSDSHCSSIKEQWVKGFVYGVIFATSFEHRCPNLSPSAVLFTSQQAPVSINKIWEPSVTITTLTCIWVLWA